MKAQGQIRRSQVITTWGPGALLDLPLYSVIVGSLESWPKVGELEEIDEPRLSRKLQAMTGVTLPRLYAPPADSNDPQERPQGIGIRRFPLWFLVQEEGGGKEEPSRSRRLVHRKALDEKTWRFDGHRVVPTRFVRACKNGHVDDLDWKWFVHGSESTCFKQLWLDEQGTSGDLADITVRCECGKRRSMFDASELPNLGICQGARPWIGPHAREECRQPSRLLIRTAANAYFPQVVSALSLPDHGSVLQIVIKELWDDLSIVSSLEELTFLKKKPHITDRLEAFLDEDVLAAIRARMNGPAEERPLKQVELDAILAVREGYGDDIPIDPNFHARRLPERAWRQSPLSDGIESVIQLHRLREVMALTGFTRFEAVTPDIHGEYEPDVQVAQLAEEPRWFPAVENRGEGIFLRLRAAAVNTWLQREAVKERVDKLARGHQGWLEEYKGASKRVFPGGPYVLLHTLSHLLIQSLSIRCGYPSSSIRERIYADSASQCYGLLLFTGSPDADGTLGGLVQQARHVEAHMEFALRMGALCSNDPVCALHRPGDSLEKRWFHGAACHGCALVAETCCEMRNDYLDRALVVPVLGLSDAAFFESAE
jgi:hypothetical protein